MREINFRFWDCQNKKMLGICDLYEEIAVPAIMGEITKYKTMQYTGLHDKNGQPIYEGDVVILENEHKDGGNVLVCVFIHGQFAWQYYKTKNDVWPQYQHIWYEDIPEISGNIYENPELLTEGE